MGATAGLDPEWARRVRQYPPFFMGAVAVAFAFVILAGNGSSTASGRVGGDFPAFYGAGSIVANGEIDDLYDPSTQAAAQDHLLGQEDGFIMYPYAPYVAAAYSPLSRVPYRVAYVIHTLIMGAALIGALWLLRPQIGVLERWFGAAAAIALTSYPIFVGIGGGQNAALSLLLIAAVWRLLADDRQLGAGIVIALLMYRPQYALPLLGLLILGRYWRAAAGAIGGATLVWLANAWLFGTNWLTLWLQQVQPLLEADAEINAANEIAPIGFLHAIFGTGSSLALVAGGAVSAAIACYLSWQWWNNIGDLSGRMVTTTSGLMLLGPHAIFYDFGLTIFATALLLDRRLVGPTLVVTIWAIGLAQLANPVLDASPLAPVALFVFVATSVLVRNEVQSPTDSARVLPIQDSYSV